MTTTQMTPTATDQAKAIAAMPADMAILKLENETIQSLAAARPRDFEQIKAELASQLNAFPQLADEAIYSKPVGKDPNTGVMKHARGLSVRAAETLAEAYGFNRVRVDVTPIDDDSVKVEATFTDYQKGRIWQDAGIVSKFFKNRRGQMQRTPDDRFYNVIVKAEASRRIREVILRSINPGLKLWYEDQIERIAMKLLTDAEVEKIIAKFQSIGASTEQIEHYVGRPRAAGWTQEDRLTLLGLWNALKQGETTIEEAFEINGQSTRKLKSGDGPVSASDLTGDGPAKESEQPVGPDPDKRTADDPPKETPIASAIAVTTADEID